MTVIRMKQRSEHGRFSRPALAQTGADGASVQSGALYPFRDCASLAVDGQQVIAARIATLLCLCRPTNVARRIVAVIVDALERVSRSRPRSYMSEEGSEIINPLGAHRNSPRSIIMKLRVLFVETSALCVSPGLIFRDPLRWPTITGFHKHLTINVKSQVSNG